MFIDQAIKDIKGLNGMCDIYKMECTLIQIYSTSKKTFIYLI